MGVDKLLNHFHRKISSQEWILMLAFLSLDMTLPILIQRKAKNQIYFVFDLDRRAFPVLLSNKLCECIRSYVLYTLITTRKTQNNSEIMQTLAL